MFLCNRYFLQWFFSFQDFNIEIRYLKFSFFSHLFIVWFAWIKFRIKIIIWMWREFSFFFIIIVFPKLIMLQILFFILSRKRNDEFEEEKLAYRKNIMSSIMSNKFFPILSSTIFIFTIIIAHPFLGIPNKIK